MYIKLSLRETASLLSKNIFEFGHIIASGQVAVLHYFLEHNLIRRGVGCVHHVDGHTAPWKGQARLSVTSYGVLDAVEKNHWRRKPSSPEHTLCWRKCWHCCISGRQKPAFSATVVQWFQYFCNICSWKPCHTPLLLGRPGCPDDESVVVKAKYNRGEQLCVKQRRVFHIYDKVDKVDYIHIEMLTICCMAITQKFAALGTAICSAEWAAYRQLSSLGYDYNTVNHSRHFRHPQNGTCTNHVEAYWCAVKCRFKSMCGTTKYVFIIVSLFFIAET